MFFDTASVLSKCRWPGPEPRIIIVKHETFGLSSSESASAPDRRDGRVRRPPIPPSPIRPWGRGAARRPRHDAPAALAAPPSPRPLIPIRRGLAGRDREGAAPGLSPGRRSWALPITP